MDSDSIVKIVLLLFLIAASGFFSGSESAFFSLGMYRVRRLKGKGNRSFSAAHTLLSKPSKLISTLLTGNEFVNAAIGVVGASLIYDLFHEKVEPEALPWLGIFLVVPFVVVFGEIIPKSMALRNPERYVSLNAIPLSLFSRAVAPIRDFLNAMSQRLVKILGEAPSSGGIQEEVFRSMVDAGTEEGVLDDQEKSLIHNVFQLDDVQVRQIMTPKEKVAVLSQDMSLDEALRIIEEEKYSRFPVLKEDKKTVAGVLYIKDLLNDQELGLKNPVSNFMRNALTVSPDNHGLALFAQFRSKQTHFGVVVDGADQHMIGIVTLEDVLEEIFGEIRDEQDVEEGLS